MLSNGQSTFAQQFHEWKLEALTISQDYDSRKALFAWAAALIAGHYETGDTRTWDCYFANRGVM